jgi:transposase
MSAGGRDFVRPVTRAAVLDDVQWARIEPLLPSSDGQRGRPFRDHRQVIEGIVYRFRTGVAWRDLPRDFGPWQTVWKRHHRFSLDGTWDRIHTRLLAEADAAGEIDWTGRARDRDEGCSGTGLPCPALTARPDRRLTPRSVFTSVPSVSSCSGVTPLKLG